VSHPHAPYRVERHHFLVPIPAEPPRPLTARVWLAWLVHSTWTRATLYAALLPIYMVVFARDGLVHALRDDRSLVQAVMAAICLGPAVPLVVALAESVSFARLVSAGTCVITRVRGVQAETVRARQASLTYARFEYQGARDGVNLQGGWSGRIRFQRQPLDGHWQFGLTTSLDDPEPGPS
jgi:hypothetical protein